MNNIDLSKPTRQSVKGLTLIFLQSIRQAIRMFWAVILVFVLQKNLLNDKTVLAIGIPVILVLLVVHYYYCY